jgi:hypothetical protein
MYKYMLAYIIKLTIPDKPSFVQFMTTTRLNTLLATIKCYCKKDHPRSDQYPLYDFLSLQIDLIGIEYAENKEQICIIDQRYSFSCNSF